MKIMQVILKNIRYSLLIVLLLNVKTTLLAQDKKYITVTGSAEMEIDPDEVELSITVHCERSILEKIENSLEEICKKHNVPEDQLSFKSNTNVVGFGWWHYWWDWWYYRNSSYIVQTYKLKLDSKTNMLNLSKDLNKSWVQNIAITKTSNKNITMFRKEVKKEAIKMAKEKAKYLLEAIDEEIGGIISIEEISSDNKPNNYNGLHYPYYGYGYYGYSNFGTNNISNSNSNMSSNSVMSNSSSSTNQEDDKIGGLSKIKLRYEVKTVFEIK